MNIRASLEKIRIIEDSTLADCSEVEELNLQYNKISEISKNSFRSQQNLRELYLHYNQIKILQPSVFDPLTSLTTLRLHKNLIEFIEDSLFSKNEKLEYLSLHENKIVAVGPNAFQHLSQLKFLALYGNPCMHPIVTDETNPQNLGIFFSEESGHRKWQNENNTCVSSYAVQRCVNERKIEKENFEKKLSDAENKANTCDLKYETLFGISENSKLKNENERGKSFKIISVLSIIVILLIIVIIGLSVSIWKHRTKIADQKDQIIRLDRLAPKHIYEPVDQEPEPEPEPEYEEIQ